MTTNTPAISISAEWEHDIVASTNGTTSLVVHLRTPDAAPSGQQRAPIDLAFALDRSGSMGGWDKIELVKQAVAMSCNFLTDDDRVSLVIFDNDVEVIHELSEATPHGKQMLQRALQMVFARGGTNLSGGWLTACQQLATAYPIRGSRRISRTILLTDGQANIGIVDSARLTEHASGLRARGISTTTVGVGYGFDEFLLSSMAEAGGGNFQYVDTAEKVAEFFQRELGEIGETVAVQPTLHVTFPHGMRARLVNSFPVTREGSTIKIDLRDLAARDRVSLVFDITVDGLQDAADLAPEMSLRWHEPTSGDRQQVKEAAPAIHTGDASRAVRNDEVGTLSAMERADRDRREATRLDREGRVHESRAMFTQASQRLAYAPLAGEFAQDAEAMRRESADFAAMSAPMSEDHRKRLMSDSMRRSRGTRK